jgi:hypothetical protein
MHDVGFTRVNLREAMEEQSAVDQQSAETLPKEPVVQVVSTLPQKSRRVRYRRRLEVPLFKTISVLCPKCEVMLPTHGPPHWCYTKSKSEQESPVETAAL